MIDKSFSEAFEHLRVILSTIPTTREKSNAAVSALKEVFIAHQRELCRAYKDHPVAFDKKVYRAGDVVPDGWYWGEIGPNEWTPVSVLGKDEDKRLRFVWHTGRDRIQHLDTFEHCLIPIDPPEAGVTAEEMTE